MKSNFSLLWKSQRAALSRTGRGGGWRHFQDHEFDLANCSRCISLSGSFARGLTEGEMSKLHSVIFN